MSGPRKPGETGLHLAMGDAPAPLDEPSAAEGALWARRHAEGPTAAEREVLWLGVERRLWRQGQGRPSRRFALGVAAAGLAAAAAAGLFVVRAQRPAPLASAPPRLLPLDSAEETQADPAAAAALALAEAQSREASLALEAEVAARMATLGEAEARGLERALAPARERLEAARTVALLQDDLPGRLRVLTNEARYLRSLSRALRSAEEAAP